MSSSSWNKSSSVNLAPAASQASITDYNLEEDEKYETSDDVEILARQYMTDLEDESSYDISLDRDGLYDELRENSIYDKSSETCTLFDLEEEFRQALQEKEEPISFQELLRSYDPESPAPVNNIEELQTWIECQSVVDHVERLQKIVTSARNRKDYTSLKIVQKHVKKWFPKLLEEFTNIQNDYILYRNGGKDLSSAKLRGIHVFGPFLAAVPPEKLAVIASHQALVTCLKNDEGKPEVSYLNLCLKLGSAVEEEVLIQRVLQKRREEMKEKPSQVTHGDKCKSENQGTEEGEFGWMYSMTHLRQYFDELFKFERAPPTRRTIRLALKKTRQVLVNDVKWSLQQLVHVGAALWYVLRHHAMVRVDGAEERVFRQETVWKSKNRLTVAKLNESFQRMVKTEDVAAMFNTTYQRPMVMPPKLWTSPRVGGYIHIRTDLMRVHGCQKQKEVLGVSDLSTLLDGLNALGRVPWKINKRLYDVAKRCMEDNIPLGDIPTQTNFEVPPKPNKLPFVKLDKESPDFAQRVADLCAYKEALKRHRRFVQKNYDLTGLRISARLKLGQALQFQEFDKIYFPYNIDFRGRVYPVPPHLSIVGSDLCRGLLQFSTAKPLGKRGFFWLKVHLANLAGNDKLTFEARAAFVDENMDKIRRSVETPFEKPSQDEKPWWMTLEDPFQALAACIEIVNAIDSGDPESYMCSFPVQMDGSCNGLQHYAALGLDPVGGMAVNLRPSDKPQDVYSGVMTEVVRRVAKEADRTLDFDTSDPSKLSEKQEKELRFHNAAKLLNGLIDRGVVKRPVMTSVYGVTLVGARAQIEEKLVEKFEAQGRDVDAMEKEIFHASMYLAKLTMTVIGELFTGADETKKWLITCARLMTQHGYPVAWVSPVGVPCVQPYRRDKDSVVCTIHGSASVRLNEDHMPIHKTRQVSAFPPNFIHSLDSSHMLLTALEMDRRGLTFAAVHDSYWTHACDVDEMNVILRDTFLELYSRPILSDLRESWMRRYPDIDFPEIPERGTLDLKEVKEARYFFQ